MRWQCCDTSARLEHARNHEKASCNKGMYVDNLCSELYSLSVTLPQKPCQSTFQIPESLLLSLFIKQYLCSYPTHRNVSRRILCRTAKRTGRFFFLVQIKYKAIRYARRHSRKHRKKRQEYLLQMNNVWKAAHVMSRYIYIYGLNDDKHDTAIKADSKPIHQRVGTVTNEEAHSPMVTCSHQKGCSHQWGPRIINRDTQGFHKLPYSFVLTAFSWIE